MKHLLFGFVCVVVLVALTGCPASQWPGAASAAGAEARETTDAGADEQRLPLSVFHVYRGNTHGHTVYTWSHGEHRIDHSNNSPLKDNWDQESYRNFQGPPARHFELARENGYDFYVVTDHSQEEPLQPANANNAAWADTLAAAERHTDENFVAMAGTEYSRNPPFDKDRTGTGHLNAINVAEYVNAANVSIPEFYRWLKEAKPAGGDGCVVASFNHPGQSQFNDWDYRDDDIAKRITLFELRTVYRGQPRWRAYVRALNHGWKVAPITVLDNHGYWVIENRPPLTYVLATELTKAALTRAMRQRRTFASWNQDVEVRYSVNGHVMGSILDGRATTFDFHIQVKTAPGVPGERVRRIQILRNHPADLDAVEIAAEALFEDADEHEVTWQTMIEDDGSRYFLLRIHHENDMTDGQFDEYGSTYAAPVWTRP